MGWKRIPGVVLGNAVGFLVFLVGVSVCFESIVLGLLIVGGSCLVVPWPRRALTANAEFDVPRLLVLAIVVGSLAAPSMVFDSYETGTYFGTDEDVTVHVASDGEWEGEIHGATSFRRIQGVGNDTVAVWDNDRTIEAFAEKTGDASGELTISIRIGGDVVAEETATDGERRADVEHRIPIFGD